MMINYFCFTDKHFIHFHRAMHLHKYSKEFSMTLTKELKERIE